MVERLRRLLRHHGPLSARTLRLMLDVLPGELLVMLREVGAMRCDHGGRVLWRLP
jgi:hypothetical protein